MKNEKRGWLGAHRRGSLVISVMLGVCWSGTAAAQPKVGDRLENVKLRDANDEPATLPDFGAKVLALFYTDADAADVNDPLADALKAANFDLGKYRGLGVADLEDSKAPNFIIRKIIRGKIEKYNSTILTDPDLSLPKAWKLGDCNNTGVVVVIGKDQVVRYINKGAVGGPEIKAVVELVAALIAGTAPAP